jgi:hypothetical protein
MISDKRCWQGLTLSMALLMACVSRHASGQVQVDANFPGGNIIVDRIQDDSVYVHQDLRDTKGDWFYWYFRVRGTAGRKLTVHFTGSNVLGVRGPAVSDDQGQSWRWLGADAVRDRSFQYACRRDQDEVRFCFGIPYLKEDFDEFLQAYADHPHLKIATLCQSKKGRFVERLHVGCIAREPDHRVLITCRHHACEMMASYSLEGLLAAVMKDSQEGAWLQEHVEMLVIPFVDKDGVEDGDQGKNRKPRDHNRDYLGDSIHPEVAAIRKFVPQWSKGKLRFALDMHDPWIRGPMNEVIYLVENNGPTTENVRRFSRILETRNRGALPFLASDNLAFGTSWNTAANYRDGMSFARWAASQPKIDFAATIEIPYANVRGQAVTADSARALGRELAQALYEFLAK